MPLYDYGCPDCGAKKEVRHPVSEIGKIRILCDSCGNPMRKLLSVPALIGFDEVGRSIIKKEKAETTENKSTEKGTSDKSGASENKTMPKPEGKGD